MPAITTARTLPELLHTRAVTHPDATAYTFVDYEIDPTGLPESLTWAQVEQRALAVAEELSHCGQPGDRAAILAPEGLDYLAAFLGALQAGFIAVPLPVPQFRVHDERVSAALRDSAPVVILTTSGVLDEVAPYANERGGSAGPRIIEVDSLDLWSEREPTKVTYPDAAYLQYTSGSTRTPAGVVVSHRNVIANLAQAAVVYFSNYGNTPPAGLEQVSWLPFHHDMGLFFSVFTPMYSGISITFTRPISFLQKPARWLQMLASHPQTWSCAPNFAFDLATRRTSDDDLDGLDLAGVLAITSGSERVHPATIARFQDRFAPFNLSANAVLPSYGLAEATLVVAAPEMGQPVKVVGFDSEQFSTGVATPDPDGRTRLVSYGPPRIFADMCTVRIVDADNAIENPSGHIGEIWLHGDNVAAGYWRKPAVSRDTFGAHLANPTPGTPAGPWLRTGDLGAIVHGELFIIGRSKDVLIVDGRNHYPDDIEATIRDITGGRVAAIAITDDDAERLVVIVELAGSGGDQTQRFRAVKRDVMAAVGSAHSLRVADLVLVNTGAIPFTTSGKVRRSACVQSYRDNEFKRLDVSASLLDEVW